MDLYSSIAEYFADNNSLLRTKSRLECEIDTTVSIEIDKQSATMAICMSFETEFDIEQEENALIQAHAFEDQLPEIEGISYTNVSVIVATRDFSDEINDVDFFVTAKLNIGSNFTL